MHPAWIQRPQQWLARQQSRNLILRGLVTCKLGGCQGFIYSQILYWRTWQVIHPKPTNNIVQFGWKPFQHMGRTRWHISILMRAPTSTAIMCFYTQIKPGWCLYNFQRDELSLYQCRWYCKDTGISVLRLDWVVHSCESVNRSGECACYLSLLYVTCVSIITSLHHTWLLPCWYTA